KHALGLCRTRLVRNRLEQLLLAVEIDVERPLRDAGRAGDFPHAGAVKSLGHKDFSRPIKDLLALGAFLALCRRWDVDFKRIEFHGNPRSRSVERMTERFGRD